MQRYRIIFDGQLKPEASLEDVQRKLADLFQVQEDQIKELFARSPMVLKEDLDYQEALADKTSFEDTGALCRLEVQPARHQDTMHTRRAPEGITPTHGASRQYSLWHPYFLSFFSRSFYTDVLTHWRGLAFTHLLIVLLLCTTVYVFHFQSLIAAFIVDEAQAIIAQVPEIRVEKGKVQILVEEPYRILRPSDNQVFAVIDTTGEITSFEQTEGAILLTESQLRVRLSPEDIRILDLSQVESLTIDQDTLLQWLLDAQKWSPFILFPLVLSFLFLFRSIQALLYGGIGMMLATVQKTPLPYSGTVSIAIMAMTPVLLLDALLVLLDITLPLWGLGGFLMAMAFLVFGIRSATRQTA